MATEEKNIAAETAPPEDIDAVRAAAAEGKHELGEQKSRGFGKWGWWIIIFVGLLMFLANGAQTDGLNLLVSQFSYVNGWAESTVLALNTPAGYIALAIGVPLGMAITRFGPRKVLFFLLAIGGVAYAMMGHTSNIVVYFIFESIMCTCANCFSVHAANTLIANWFPKRKGMALGWATMGMNASSAAYTPILSFLFARFTLGMSLNILGGITVALAVVTLIFIRDTPEELGCTPDNEVLTPEQIAANKEEHDSYKTPWTFGKLLKDKDTWMLGICFGCFMLVTVGIMSQLVTRIMERGFAQTYAITCVSICAVIGLAGSYLWGLLDIKIGTKKSTVIFGCWYAVAILFNVIPNTACMYISIVMIGVSIGGTANFAPSMTTNIFGRRDFPLAFTVVSTIYNVMRVLAYAVLALVLAAFGSYTVAYVLFIILALVGAFLASRIDQTEKSLRPPKEEKKKAEKS